MEKTFGQKLKQYRELTMLTLREVETASGVSNAYLSQLENDKIKRPSAQVLHKLSEVYGIKIEELLAAAGMINAPASEYFPKTFGVVTPDEQTELMEYLQFMRWRKKRTQNSIAEMLRIPEDTAPGFQGTKLKLD